MTIAPENELWRKWTDDRWQSNLTNVVKFVPHSKTAARLAEYDWAKLERPLGLE